MLQNNVKKNMVRILAVFSIIFSLFLLQAEAVFAALSCSLTTAAGCTGGNFVLLRMSSSTNAHAEISTGTNSNYANNAICCGGISGMSNSCSGTFNVVADLSSTTNAHVEEYTGLNVYTNDICISVPSGSITTEYRTGTCSGFDTAIFSISSTTNAHIGGPTAYSYKLCGSLAATTQTLTFSISDNTVGFGPLSSGAARYATGDTIGSSTEVETHNMIVNTNAAAGYTMTVIGPTLTSGSNTITAIGGTNTASSVGTEQFGLRMTATGGSGTVASPYAASGFAYAANATTQSQTASEPTGDGVDTTYSVRYLGNISGNTDSGSYTTNLVYSVTANY